MKGSIRFLWFKIGSNNSLSCYLLNHLKTSLINTWGKKNRWLLKSWICWRTKKKKKKVWWQNREIRIILSVLRFTRKNKPGGARCWRKKGIVSSFGSWISFIFLGCPDTPEPSATPFSEKEKNSSFEEPQVECTGKYRAERRAAKSRSPGAGIWCTITQT